MEGLRARTKLFALRVIRLGGALPRDSTAQVLGKQLLRSGTSVAANFREATRARSEAEFLSKLAIVEQELDETQLWIELLAEAGIIPRDKVANLHQEADELLKITISTIRKTKAKQRKP